MKQHNLLKKIYIKKLIKGILLYAGIMILLLIAGVWMINIIIGKAVHSRNEVVVPEIEGKTMNEALTILSKKNLSLYKIAEKYDIDIPAGSIISQSPPPGLIVREGKPIECVISAGGKVVFVPEVEGKSLRQSELLLRQAGLLMGEQIRTFSSTLKRDFVVSQEPEAGKVVEKNSYINLIVSKGPAEEEKIKKMPNLLGRNMTQTELILKELGLEVFKFNTIINDDLDEGIIVEQAPEQGTLVDENSKVKLTISKQSRSLKEVRDATVYHEVIQSGLDKVIKIVIIDSIGERVVYEQEVAGGTKIDIPVKVLGEAKAKIFSDDILIREEDIAMGAVQGDSEEEND